MHLCINLPYPPLSPSVPNLANNKFLALWFFSHFRLCCFILCCFLIQFRHYIEISFFSLLAGLIFSVLLLFLLRLMLPLKIVPVILFSRWASFFGCIVYTKNRVRFSTMQLKFLTIFSRASFDHF